MTPGVEQLLLGIVPRTHALCEEEEVVEQKYEQMLPTFRLKCTDNFIIIITINCLQLRFHSLENSEHLQLYEISLRERF